MRTTLNQQIHNTLTMLNQSSNALTKAQTHAATGKRINKGSDDVLGTNRSLMIRSSINSLKQFANNISVSQPMLQTAADAISDLVKQVQTVRTIAIAANNDTLSASERDAYVKQLDDIMLQMADTANSRYMDQYIFSGTDTNTPPIGDNHDGIHPYIYMGNSDVRKSQVLQWVKLPVGIAGDRLFNFNGAAGSNSTDLFTMVKQLKDAVSLGYNDGIGNQLSNIDANLNNLLSCSAQVGSWLSRMESAKNILSESEDRLKEVLSATEDIDLAQAIVDLKTQENVYRSALAVSAQMFDMSLASLRFS